MNKLIFGISFLCLFTFSSCKQQDEKDRKPLARVDRAYLYKDQIDDIVPKQAATDDSLVILNNYITHWATEQLLLNQAKINLPQEKQDEFEKLVEGYRKELYTEAYKDVIISKDLDTTLSNARIESYFQANQENFKLDQDLVKLRYIQLNKKFPKLDEIKEDFKRFNKEDQLKLEKKSLKFNSYAFNDSIWVSAHNIYKEVKPLTAENKEKFLRKDNFLELKDSSNVYLVYVKDVLRRNEKAPLEYVKPTIKQILLNKKKLELSRKLEKDITKDAIKNNEFEIYN